MSHSDDLGAIKIALQGRIFDLLRSLGIPDKPRGGAVYPRNPRRPDKKPGSFVIWTSPARAGNWKDFASGEKGDVFCLIQYLHGSSLKEAIRYARGYTGIGEDLDPEERRRIAREAAAMRAEADAKAEAEARRKRIRAAQIWNQATPQIFGTLVESYARSRGIDLRALRLEPGAHRFLPSWDYWLGKEQGMSAPKFPVMLTAMRDEDGTGRALHFTYLAPDGSGKAPVAKPKVIWPESISLVMRISQGITGMSAELAPPKSEVVAFAEGVEDAWTIAQADPDLRVWAAGSLSGLTTAYLPFSAEAVLVAADNDWGKPQATKQLAYAVKRFAASRPTEVMRSSVGKDFNDQLQSERQNG